jgi:glycosyltransferase involved in cell wall biosynthesis
MTEKPARPVLLTVSGRIDPDLHRSIDEGRRPRADYLVMAERFHADLLDYTAARESAGPIARFVGRFAGDDVLLAWACFRRRRRYEVVFTDGEQIGLPFAALCWLTRRRPRHVMIGHLLSPRRKVLLHRALHLRRAIDVVVVYSSAQGRVAVEQLGYRPEQIRLTPFMVDTAFWQPPDGDDARPARPMICAAGQELRDYPTLVEAVRDLDVDVVIAAASPWSKRPDSSAGIDVPENVRVGAYNLFDLRHLYAGAAFVVVPLEETDFQAGITTILEAMSMGRAVVCSRTQGQSDTIIDGATGIYVPPGDSAALAAAIQRLLADPELAARMGAAGRQWAIDHADVEAYADQLAELVEPSGH